MVWDVWIVVLSAGSCVNTLSSQSEWISLITTGGDRPIYLPLSGEAIDLSNKWHWTWCIVPVCNKHSCYWCAFYWHKPFGLYSKNEFVVWFICICKPFTSVFKALRFLMFVLLWFPVFFVCDEFCWICAQNFTSICFYDKRDLMYWCRQWHLDIRWKG